MSINRIEFVKQDLIEVKNASKDLLILDGKTAKDLDTKIINNGILGFDLMKMAASASMQAILLRWPHAKSYSIFCGAGNNGGDGITLGVMLKQAGKQVQCVLLAGDDYENEARQALDVAKKVNLKLVSFADWQEEDGNSGEEVLIDAIFGIGLNKKPLGVYAEAIEKMNASKWQIAALDLPSGIDSNTGEKHLPCIKAELTIAFLALKQGVLNAEARENIGRLYLAELGFDAKEFLSDLTLPTYLPSKDSLKLQARSDLAHKGTTGNLLIIGGFAGTNGAVGLAAGAALRAGAGRVKVLTLAENNSWLLARHPELMLSNATDKASILEMLAWCDALVIGCGLGKTAWGREIWDLVRNNYTEKAVIDADALNLWSQGLLPNEKLRANACILPHPMEAARLLNSSVEQIQADRQASCSKLLELSDYGVLKGADSLIFTKSAKFLCRFGNGGMASAGMGDILSGLIGGLLAQGIDLENASKIGAIAHAKAGDVAANKIGKRGLTATDLLEFIPAQLN